MTEVLVTTSRAVNPRPLLKRSSLEMLAELIVLSNGAKDEQEIIDIALTQMRDTTKKTKRKE